MENNYTIFDFLMETDFLTINMEQLTDLVNYMKEHVTDYVIEVHPNKDGSYNVELWHKDQLEDEEFQDISSAYPKLEIRKELMNDGTFLFDPYKYTTFCESDTCDWNDRDSKQEAIKIDNEFCCPLCKRELSY